MRWTFMRCVVAGRGLTLYEDCTPSRMHLPVGPHSHSMLFPAVGLYQLLPSHLTPEGSGRVSGCWCPEVRSRILLVPPLIWHRSQVHFCPRWWHLGTLNHLQQEVLNAGGAPLSTSELEYCRKQSRLKCTAACLSPSITRRRFSAGATKDLWWHKSKKTVQKATNLKKKGQTWKGFSLKAKSWIHRTFWCLSFLW